MVRLLVYCDYIIKIYVGINATTQEVFSTCLKPLGVLFGDYIIEYPLVLMPRLRRCSQ